MVNARWMVQSKAFGVLRALAGVLALFVALLPLAPGALAADDEDLPLRVGRVADVGGELLLAPQDRPEEWSPIGINYPVASGDNLWVGAEGRAEIDYGAGQFRLAGDTSVHVSRLEDRQLALFVAQGRVIVRLRFRDRDEVATVDTPNTQVQLTRPGLYRIEVSPDRSATTVVVREGEALVAIAGGAQQVLPGQVATVSGADPAYADVRSGYGIDGFDAWSADRDRGYERSRSANYVSRQMPGWAELDRYGAWDAHPTYGAIWYPTRVAVDWAPYRFGRWAHVGRWGWTWIDDAPWGYAPSHYGRWVWVGGRWGWSPGAFVARPVWAPALVGWVGGSGWAIAVTAGGPVYGWVPLGWGDAYVPWWGRGGCGQRCWSSYNRPYAVPFAVVRAERPVVPVAYSNGRVPGAVSAVAGATLAAQRPVGSNLVAVPAGAPHAPVMGSPPPVKPLRLPETRPTTGAPAAASTFYPSARPRHPVDPPVTSVAPVAPADPARRPGADRAPAGTRPAPAVSAAPAAVPPPTSARPSVAPPAHGSTAPGTGSPPTSARPSFTAPGVTGSVPPTSARPSSAGSAAAPPLQSGIAPPTPSSSVPASRPDARPLPPRQQPPAAAPRSDPQAVAPHSRGAPSPVTPAARGPAPASPVAAPPVPSAPAAHGAPAARGTHDTGGSAPAATPPGRQTDRVHGNPNPKPAPDANAPAPAR